MKLKAIFPLFLLVLISYAGFAQGKISFEKEAHEFGTIKEEEGNVKYVFSFKNTGNKDLNLEQVKASCGCTTPDWTREPIPAGGEGFVSAEFNPKNRPGKFEKFITVKTDGQQPKVIFLRIKGQVTPREKGPKDFYPFKDGNLRMKTNHIAFGEVNYPGQDTGSTILYNEGERPIELDLRATEIPDHITMVAEKTVIQPGERIRLDFTYDSSQKEDYGFLFEFIMLRTNDDAKALKRLNLSADVKEDFSKLSTTDKANAPKISFDKVEHDFGKLTMGDEVDTQFKITNNGKSKLLIRKTKASCGCTASKPQKTELEPGESTFIDVSFNSIGKKGHVVKYITVISNDPKNAEQRLKIRSQVEQPNNPIDKKEENQ